MKWWVSCLIMCLARTHRRKGKGRGGGEGRGKGREMIEYLLSIDWFVGKKVKKI